MCIGQMIYNLSPRPSGLINNCLLGSFFLNTVVAKRLKLPEDEQWVWKEYIKILSRQE